MTTIKKVAEVVVGDVIHGYNGSILKVAAIQAEPGFAEHLDIEAGEIVKTPTTYYTFTAEDGKSIGPMTSAYACALVEQA